MSLRSVCLRAKCIEDTASRAKTGDQVAVIADRTIDTSGLSCPIPILKAKKALAEMAAGSTLEVVATDPAAPKDFEAFCRATGNGLEQSLEDAGTYRFFIRRAP